MRGSWRPQLAGSISVHPPDVAGALLLAVAMVASIGVAWWAVTGPTTLRFTAAVVVGVAVVGLSAVSPRGLLYALVPWFAALGLLRRIFSEYGTSGSADPLLVVGPLALGLLALIAIRRDAFRSTTPLMKAVFVLGLLVVLGALNPLQGSLAAGAASLLFVLVPLFGFFIGRALDDQTLRTFLRLVATFGIVVALYGLSQTVYGFTSWDTAWIQEQQRNYASLGVFTAGGGNLVTRPFGSASSAAEYGYFLAIALVIWAVGGVTRRLLLRIPAVTLLFAALLLEASRGILLAAIVGLLFVLAVRRRVPLSTALAVIVLVILCVPFVLKEAQFGAGGATPIGVLVGHQIQGFRDPLNPEASTLGVHVAEIVRGLKSPFAHPLGYGLASVTIAAHKYSGTVAAGTEADVSNVGVALGLPGLLVYLVVLVLAVRRLYGVALRRQDTLALMALAIAFVVLLQWLNGGLYAVAWLPWLMIGWADRRVPDG